MLIIAAWLLYGLGRAIHNQLVSEKFDLLNYFVCCTLGPIPTFYYIYLVIKWKLNGE